MTTRRSWSWQLLRMGFGLCLLAMLVWRIHPEKWRRVLAGAMGGWKWWLAGVICTGVGLLAGAARWKILLTAQGLAVSFGRVFSIFFIGQFFNAFMLGSCGGDAARAYYVSRWFPGRRTEAIFTVLLDRAIGLAVTLVVAAAVTLVWRDLFDRAAPLRVAAILMQSLFFVSPFALWAVLKAPAWLRRARKFLSEDSRPVQILKKLYRTALSYRNHPLVLIEAIVLSLINLALLTLACLCFGWGIDRHLPTLPIVLLFPVLTIVAALPLTPGSLGVREGLFVALLPPLGIPYEAALSISLLVYGGSLLWSLFGGAVFVGYTEAEGTALRQAIQAIRESAEPDLSQLDDPR